MSALVLVHGGAGHVPEDRRAEHVAGCLAAARAGQAVLRAGHTALEAAVAAVEAMESDPRYNAGTGGSLTAAGTLELDAAVMEGQALRAGAVAALPPFPHPVRIAQALLEAEGPVMLAGAGAA
ncbi:MAG: isoaspartyl peptidase/L-asparaginase, partial [Myxococcota bacterium]